MKNLFLFTLLTVFFACSGQKNKGPKGDDYLITIHTSFGDMKAILYEETPLHKENFIKLAKEGKYDSTIFHRVIEKFMVQGGDVNRKQAGVINYTIPAEFKSHLYHHKGALSAARMGDNVNPKKESSGCQFYIVQGNVYDTTQLQQMANNSVVQTIYQQLGKLVQKPEHAPIRETVMRYQSAQQFDSLTTYLLSLRGLVEKEFGEIEATSFTDQQIKDYSTIGGAPHLDGGYTVFGRVVEGLDVIDKIAAVETGAGDLPLDEVHMTMEMEKVAKKEITKKYGYEYPADTK